jgi:hypothetical protein
MTAVEWLAEQYYYSDGKLTRQDFEQAKEIEKQQIIDAHGQKKDYSFSLIYPQIITGEQYYNETFKNTKK